LRWPAALAAGDQRGAACRAAAAALHACWRVAQNPGDWATPDDYPSRPLREGVQGTTSFKVTVGPNGRVTACEVTGSSGNAELDAATCKLVTQRAASTRPRMAKDSSRPAAIPTA
jgi:TonB family protein